MYECVWRFSEIMSEKCFTGAHQVLTIPEDERAAGECVKLSCTTGKMWGPALLIFVPYLSPDKKQGDCNNLSLTSSSPPLFFISAQDPSNLTEKSKDNDMGLNDLIPGHFTLLPNANPEPLPHSSWLTISKQTTPSKFSEIAHFSICPKYGVFSDLLSFCASYRVKKKMVWSPVLWWWFW